MIASESRGKPLFPALSHGPPIAVTPPPPLPPSPSLEALITDLGWMKALATAIVGEQRAEDLAQEAAQRALESPPEHEKNLPGWLARVMANLAASDGRQRKRREELVRTVAPASYRAESADGPTPQEAAAQTENIQFMLEIVHELPKEQSTLIVQAYAMQRPQAKIAQDLGISTKAVERRLARALQSCRQRWEQRYGKGWELSCLAVIQGIPAPMPTIDPTLLAGPDKLGQLIKPSTVAWAAAAGLTLAALPFLPDAGLQAAGSPTPAAVEASLAGGAARGLPEVPVDQRFRLDAAPEPATKAASRPLRIRAEDQQGRPLAEIPIGLSVGNPHPNSRYFAEDGKPHPDYLAGMTDEDGLLRIEVPLGERIAAVSADPEFVITRRGLLDSSSTEESELILQLEPGFQLAGQVLDPSGKAAPGVHVAFHLQSEGSNAYSWPAFDQVSDENGRFRMLGLKAGRYEVRVHGAGTSTFWDQVEVGPAQSGEYQLVTRPGSTLEVHVVDAESGKPVRDAEAFAVIGREVREQLRRYPVPPGVELYRVSSRDGVAQLAHAGTGPEDFIVVRAEGYLDQLVPASQLLSQPTVALEAFLLETTIEVRSQGQPVSGGTILVEWNLEDPKGSLTRRGKLENGVAEFALPCEPETQFAVRVLHEQGTAFLPSVALGQLGRPLQIDLETGSLVELLVQDQEARPVANFTAFATAEFRVGRSTRALYFQFMTDAEGRAALQLPPCTLSLELMEESGKVCIAPEPISLDGVRPAQVELLVQPARPCTVKVVDTRGRPIADRSVQLSTADGRRIQGGRTDATGHVHFENAVHGALRLDVRAPEITRGSSCRAASESFTLPADPQEVLRVAVPGLVDLEVVAPLLGDATEASNFVLEPVRSAAQAGRIHGETKAPWSLDEHGRCQVEQLPTGDYWLSLPATAERPAWITRVRVTAETRELRWNPGGGSLLGRLPAEFASEESGRRVELLPRLPEVAERGTDARRWLDRPASAEIAADGSFRFPFVPPGAWRLRLSGAGPQPHESLHIELPLGSPRELDLGELALERPAQLQFQMPPAWRGPVVDAAGSGELGACDVLHLETRSWFSLALDAKAQASHSSLPAGRYQLFLLGEPYGEEFLLLPGARLERLLTD